MTEIPRSEKFPSVQKAILQYNQNQKYFSFHIPTQEFELIRGNDYGSLTILNQKGQEFYFKVEHDGKFPICVLYEMEEKDGCLVESASLIAVNKITEDSNMGWHSTQIKNRYVAEEAFQYLQALSVE